VNTANVITLGRLLIVPVVVWLIVANRPSLAFWFFAMAGASDAVDGFIAKRFNQVSDLGRFLDPVADKALLVSIFLIFGFQGHLPAWIVILVVSRDALILGGALFSYALSLPFPVRLHIFGKANTAAQIVLAGVVLSEAGLGLVIGGAIQTLIYLVAATTLLSGVYYLVRWMRSAQRAEAP
jgi:cardiolipin synthase